MSGLSFSERVKLILQKRLDTRKWPLGDSGQGPGAIRYLTDGQGNAIAILTTSINPNDPEPIGPGSQESASQVDPTVRLGGGRDVNTGLDIALTLTKKANAKEIILGVLIGTSTNTVETLEESDGTDYQVPAGKELLCYYLSGQASVVTGPYQLGYGSDAVAEGTTDPSDTVYAPWAQSGAGAGLCHPTVADTYEGFAIAFKIPATKFPFMRHPVTTSFTAVMVLGVEYDA